MPKKADDTNEMEGIYNIRTNDVFLDIVDQAFKDKILPYSNKSELARAAILKEIAYWREQRPGTEKSVQLDESGPR
jgi:hypothetical protein